MQNRLDPNNLVRKTTESQRGLVTARQLGAAGFSKPDIDTAIRRGRLHRVRAGVYSVAPPPWPWETTVLAACLHPTAQPVASHRSAARLHGLWEFAEIELSVRYPRQVRLPGVHVHRSRDLRRDDVVRIDDIPVTNVARTVLDLGLVLPAREINRLTDHVVATGMTTRTRLWEQRLRCGAPGRNGVGPLHVALKQLPLDAELAESGPEIALLRVVLDLGLPTPELQCPVTLGGITYYPDLAYPEARLGLEYDGAIAHGTRRQQRRDRRRDAALAGAGWTILRYEWADLTQNRLRIAHDVTAHLDTRTRRAS